MKYNELVDTRSIQMNIIWHFLYNRKKSPFDDLPIETTYENLIYHQVPISSTSQNLNIVQRQ